MSERYPHMCRDGHIQIGHSDSENEMCPMCRLIGAMVIFVEKVDSGRARSKDSYRTFVEVLKSVGVEL